MPRRKLIAFLFVASLVFVFANFGFGSPLKAQDFANPFGAQGAAPMSFAPSSPRFDHWGTDDRPRTHITVRPSIQRNIGNGSHAFCVRICDGRYFPMGSGKDDAAKELCKNTCPAAEVKLFSGHLIETATADGKPYTKLLRAFHFRNATVPGCTCQHDGKAGLAHIRIEDDKTIRVGDIVAHANGLMVASHAGRNGIIFARLRASRLKAERLPAVALR